VLISGESGIGKSELALELITRGHRLIADDAPRFNKLMPDIITGSCPELLQDFLEVRGLGIMNIREMYGDGVIKRNKYLRLIIKLVNMSDDEKRDINRLKENKSLVTILGIEVPEITIPLAVGRNLAVLVEASVRNHILYMKNYSASEDFINRQSGMIKDKKAT
jgi:HPr kinase/phosphorylase